MSHYSKIETLQKKLAGVLPGRTAQELMTGRVMPMPDHVPDDARPSGVLLLLFPKNEALHLLFIRRTEDGRAHSGQISFPGGKWEPADTDLRATALREAQEEAGILSGEVMMLGTLSPLYIPVSNFMVYPFIGYSDTLPEYNISEHEVAEIIELPVDWLFEDARKIITTVRPSSRPDMELSVPAYLLTDGSYIWGATAMILSELEVVWKSL